ncbi:unnamed protein product [Rhizoctonia solani]|uniref:Uncharacterized protein n=1 Tax=Rhizoctonia solani TaxID=456999 RepID=A0A8H3BJE7_9AGAM|nr:unnamed protein product [Rhizoctonia solani]
MIVAGMNALVRRSCACPVRAFATAAKSGGHGKNKHKGGNQNQKPGDKSKSQAGTKSTQGTRQKAAPALEKKPRAAPKPVTPIVASPGTLDAQEIRPHVPLPSPNPPLSAYTISPPKLRALIDLYHSSSSYITPENLSDRIDATFAPLRNVPNMNIRYQSYRDLVAERDELDAEPDRVVPTANELGGYGYGTTDSLAGNLVAGGWSTSKGERTRMVKAALWGVDSKARIGLETLLEAKVELDAHEKEQKE